MSKGEGKGWAKGKTMAGDPRIAKNAAAHRGISYRRHLRPEDDHRHYSADGCVARTLPLEWSPTMAYVVGLMATDGCLLNTGRHLTFDPGDEELVQTFLRCLGRPLIYRKRRTQTGGVEYQAQFGDVRFYRWLEGIGLMQRKSLVLGAIDVPDALILPLARGLLDGDGSLIDHWYEGTGRAKGKRYEGFVTVFLSASGPHLEWLRGALARSLAIKGALCPQPPTERGTVMWRLAYAIRESAILLPYLYPSLDAPCLLRKRRIWEDYATRHGLPVTLDAIAESRGRYRAA